MGKVDELTERIDTAIATLAKLYEQEGRRELLELLVNSQFQISSSWVGDDEGFRECSLDLLVPASIFKFSLSEKSDLEEKIRADLNTVGSFRAYIAVVYLVLDTRDGDWRSESRALLSGEKIAPSDSEIRIWGENDNFRLFLSHRAEVKEQVCALKKELEKFGISCFVAHMDIHPTQDWRDEIENALLTMDGLAALMTKNFHESEWADQEVGFAFARGVPIVAVRLDRDPYGFIGKFQALRTTWEKCAVGLVKILIEDSRVFAAYVRALRRVRNWDTGNMLGDVLPSLSNLTNAQIDELVSAYNETDELRRAFAFNGKNAYYGDGLVAHLNRLGKRKFDFDASGLIHVVP